MQKWASCVWLLPLSRGSSSCPGQPFTGDGGGTGPQPPGDTTAGKEAAPGGQHGPEAAKGCSPGRWGRGGTGHALDLGHASHVCQASSSPGGAQEKCQSLVPLPIPTSVTEPHLLLQSSMWLSCILQESQTLASAAAPYYAKQANLGIVPVWVAGRRGNTTEAPPPLPLVWLGRSRFRQTFPQPRLHSPKVKIRRGLKPNHPGPSSRGTPAHTWAWPHTSQHRRPQRRHYPKIHQVSEWKKGILKPRWGTEPAEGGTRVASGRPCLTPTVGVFGGSQARGDRGVARDPLRGRKPRAGVQGKPSPKGGQRAPPGIRTRTARLGVGVCVAAAKSANNTRPSRRLSPKGACAERQEDLHPSGERDGSPAAPSDPTGVPGWKRPRVQAPLGGDTLLKGA